MRIILLVPFHERGYEELVKYLEKTSLPAYLPIPVELCREPMLREYVSSGLTSYTRVWSPLLDYLSSCRGCTCYLTLKYFEDAIDTSIKLLGLVFKARVFNKVDPAEWLEIAPKRFEPLAPTSWSDVLVVDRFIEYALLLEKGVVFDRVMQVEEFIPTPLDILLLVKSNIVEWNCNLKSLIDWIIKYLSEYVVPSRSLTEAYDKLKRSREYRELVVKCTSSDLIQIYF